MSIVNNLPVNFTIAPNAIRMIETIRSDWDQRFADKAAILSIAWGAWHLKDGSEEQNIVVSFYAESELAKIVGAIEHVSGMDVIFFITPENYSRFQGKVVDFVEGQWFFSARPGAGRSEQRRGFVKTRSSR